MSLGRLGVVDNPADRLDARVVGRLRTPRRKALGRAAEHGYEIDEDAAAAEVLRVCSARARALGTGTRRTTIGVT